jgi:putative DNA primase/helicase
LGQSVDHPDNPQPSVVLAAPADLQNIPLDMLGSSRWVGYKVEEHGGRPNCKVPKDPNTGGNASSTDPDTWSNFTSAISSVSRYGFDGIGLVIGEPYIAVDIDGARSPETGATEEWALELIQALNSYTELSPSRKGFHIWLKGKHPQGKDGARTDDLEVYCKKRYFTCTGAHVEGTPKEVRHLTDTEVQKVFAAVEKRRASQAGKKTKTEQATDSSRVNNNKKYALLKAGDIEAAGFEDVSAAVQSFLTYSAYYHLLDVEKVDADFRGSALYKDWRPFGRSSDWIEKWERLGPAEIAKACEKAKEWIERDRSKSTKRPSASLQQSDRGAAELLIELHGDDLWFVTQARNWYVWDGSRFAPSKKLHPERLFNNVITHIMRSTADADDDDAKKLLTWAAQLCATWKRTAALAWAQSLRPAVYEDFDIQPLLFNCANGTYDLERDEFRPADRADMLMKRSPVSYDSEAQCPKFLAGLERALPDQTVRKFLQEFAGYSLSGLAVLKSFLILLGPRHSAKSTFIELFSWILGDYAVGLEFNSLAPREGQGNSPDIVNLRGSRFASACESEQGQRLSAAVLKRLTGGIDRITACAKYEHPVTFPPTWKLWLATNEPPGLNSSDDALWDRVRRVSFDVTIPPSERDPLYLDKVLKPEGPGILNWMLEGWRRIYSDGRPSIEIPESVRLATEKYREDTDWKREWFEEKCQLTGDDRDRLFTSDAFDSFSEWMKKAGRKPGLSQQAFTNHLVKQILKSNVDKHGRKGTYFKGARLVNQQPHLPGQDEPPY